MSKYEARFNDNVESPRWRVVDEHSTVAICGNDQEGAERIAAALNAYDDGHALRRSKPACHLAGEDL
jgi:hypothetical protein